MKQRDETGDFSDESINELLKDAVRSKKHVSPGYEQISVNEWIKRLKSQKESTKAK